VLVGPESGDDAGVFLLGGQGLAATVDFIPPVCDEPERYGRIAVTNALSDLWAMGAEPLFALNLCGFPDSLPEGVGAEILAGGARALDEAGAALLGGHSVRDKETKYGIAAVGLVDPRGILALDGARPGQTLVLTKPLGTGVMINAFKFDRLDAAGFEPALVEMERPNREAGRLARELGAGAATDVTGFGLVGHALNLARRSAVTLEIRAATLPRHSAFAALVEGGVSTGCTPKNRSYAEPHLELPGGLSPVELELLFDPQTSGGLLVALSENAAASYLARLRERGHHAAEIGRVVEGPPIVRIV